MLNIIGYCKQTYACIHAYSAYSVIRRADAFAVHNSHIGRSAHC